MITGLYAGILTLMFLGLTFRIILRRAKYRTSLGDGGHSELNSHIRAHGNFAEFIPLALLIMLLLELQQADKTVLHAYGIILVLGRLCHAYSLTVTELRSKPSIRPRQIGMVLTIGALASAAITLILSRY